MNDAQLRDIAANETRMDKDLNYSSEQLFTEWSKQLSPEHMKLSIEKAAHAQYSTDNGHKRSFGYRYEAFTSLGMLEREKEVVVSVQDGFGIQKELADELMINQGLVKHQYLSNDQVNVIDMILKSTDRFNFVQGDAGTGKTTSMKVLHETLSPTDVQIIGLTYTGKAALELKQKAGFDSQTLHSFLKRPGISKDGRTLLIVDEASMVNSFQMSDIVDLAKANENVKVVFIGDWKQLQAIGAGKMFAELVDKYEDKIVELSETHRFQTTVMKTVSDNIKAYKEGINKNGILMAMAELEKDSSIVIDENSFKLIDCLINNFMDSPDDGLIVCTSNADKDHINRLCSMALIESGEVSQETVSVKSYKEKDVPLVGQQFSSQYRPGQKVFIEQAHGLTPHQIGTVEKSSEFYSVHITIDGAISHTINLQKDKIRPVEEREIDISEGSKIVFTRNDYRLGVRNGSTGKVVGINDGQIEIDTGYEQVKINQDYGFIDLGYAVTAYKSQGMDAKNVLFYYSSENHSMLNSELFYVACSRATHNLKVFTDDKEKLINAASTDKNKYSTAEKAFSEIDFEANTVSKDKTKDYCIEL
ncbi:conjugative relaxase domain protein [Candidatus Magnetomorum sp. HK-1]|nr:conjugative relaxase domain protein [Candidatus Magnetomorum sp. HK-1]